MHARAQLSALLLCVLSGCTDPLGQEVSYTVRVDVPEGLQGRVEGGAVSTCAGIDGRLFEDTVVERLELPVDGSAAGSEARERSMLQLDELRPSRAALLRAIDADIAAVAIELEQPLLIGTRSCSPPYPIGSG